MARGWRLTRQAETALLDIAHWTIDHFGPLQAAACEQDLINHCRAIGVGTTLSRPCGPLIAPDLPEDLRFVRCGQHFIVFMEADERMIVVDFLHARSDLPGQLAALAQETARRP
jgi:toxin ParE1/3/4